LSNLSHLEKRKKKEKRERPFSMEARINSLSLEEIKSSFFPLSFAMCSQFARMGDTKREEEEEQTVDCVEKEQLL
jgi:hypothetical protein